ncbi:MAG TPA: HAMP domain-containing sensor histidine kinase [Pirellulales bacterium]|jgi:hypothetical protein|nr:HAMP domain-containing sensor histidine kinase [Pirellulales bacterium]
MWFLPSLLGDDGTPRRWPLTRETGDALAEALLSAPRERAETLRQALARDPVLVEWTVCRAAQQHHRKLTGLDAIGEWLTENLARELTWTAREDFCVDLPNERNTNRGATRRLPELAEKIRELEQAPREFERRLEQLKLEALKNFAYGAGHELNNPLANIATRAQLLLKDETHPERRRRLAAINAQAFRGHEMISDLMLFARPPKLVRRNVNLPAVVEELLTKLAPEAAAQEIALALVPPDAAWRAGEISVDPVQLAVALRAILINGIEAVGHGGRIELEIRAAQGPDQREFAEMVVRDSGPGIPPEIRPHIFDPFFSGREAGRGLGFGLCKAWRIITDHGGWIEVRSAPAHGSEFVIGLPR